MASASGMEKDQPEGWRFIPLLQAGAMRWLLVAGASWLLGALGVPEAMRSAEAEQMVQVLLQTLQGFSIAWAMYHRYAKPTPPLALTKAAAEAKNAAKAATIEGES